MSIQTNLPSIYCFGCLRLISECTCNTRPNSAYPPPPIPAPSSYLIKELIIGLDRIKKYSQDPFNETHSPEVHNLELVMALGSIEHRAELLLIFLNHALREQK